MRGDYRPIKWFPLDRFSELVAAINNEALSPRATRRRDALALTLGLQGLRVGEACHCQLRDFNAPRKRLYVETSKNGIPREIELTTDTRDFFQRELASRSFASRYLLCALQGRTRGQNPLQSRQGQRLIKKVFDRLLGPGHGLVFHSLRHTFAMGLYAKTNDLLLVQQMLGHTSPNTTQIYAKSTKRVPRDCLVNLVEDLEVVAVLPDPEPDTQLRLFEAG